MGIATRWIGGALATALMTGTVLAGMGGKIAWSTDYEKGVEQAKQDNKPMMLYFTTSW
jgi:hypothetical protein